jgi:cytoplasmic iron level regulating protein YaaA (DUF328/UPF0246 family)
LNSALHFPAYCVARAKKREKSRDAASLVECGMIQIVISPAKSLDFESPTPDLPHTHPDFLAESHKLIKIVRKLAPKTLGRLMNISDQLVELNVARYAAWSPPFSLDNARQAALAFNGDVYGGLDAHNFSAEDLMWAQRHLRILSGLYGLLRPLDLIQAYRLEMGTRLVHPKGKDLYSFWGDRITQALNANFDQSAKPVLINLASDEYFRSVRPKKLAARVVTPVFQEWKSAGYKIVSFYAKRARGLMSRYAIVNRVADVEALKDFNTEGYAFAPEVSSEDTWVFRRRSA